MATSSSSFLFFFFFFSFCFFLFLFCFFSTWLSHSLMMMMMMMKKKQQQQQKKKKLQLPPGSMGWPYVGETLQLYSQHPNAFFSSKQKRYGEIFKTRILGCRCVMMASPEAARLVLANREGIFRPTFPGSKMEVIGRQALFFHEGPYHARLRRLFLASFAAPDSIRRCLPELELLAIATIDSWPRLHAIDHDAGASGRPINAFAELKKFTFKVGMQRVFGSLDSLDMEALDAAYAAMEQGYNSMPINVPGTKYHESMKARRRLHGIIHGVIRRRRESCKAMALQERRHDDFLGALMAESGDGDGSERALSDEQIVDNIIGVIFASRDTTASALTWILKFLKSDPHLLRAVLEEHERIQQSKDGESADNKNLTWEDTKNMPLTSRVIQETLRIVTILSFTFREATEDVEYKGYIIPKGWKVLPLFRNIHHNPEFFSDPLKFDPSRFEAPPKPNTFLAFGSGAHSCPGSELAKLEMLIFIHHLTTRLRWEIDESKNGIQYSPFQVPQEGLPIRVQVRRASTTYGSS